MCYNSIDLNLIMNQQKIYDLLLPLKDKTISKIRSNVQENPDKLNIFKAAVPQLNVYCTFERTFATCLGLKLQEIAAECGTNVINTDKNQKKICGVDLITNFGEGQMKLYKNTQTGTHVKDSLNKLIQNSTNPFFVTALSESYEYTKNDVLYLGGNAFWSKIGMNYSEVYDTIVQLIQETYYEVKSTIIATL